jgi:hypothetical protein
VAKKEARFLVAGPFMVWVALSLFRRWGVRGVAVPIWILFCTAVVNAPHLYRNWSTFGSFLEPPDETIHRNTAYSPGPIASNLVRNLAVHASGLPGAEPAVVEAVQRFHLFIGQDIEDPRTTFSGIPFQLGSAVSEGAVGGPLHVLLVLLCYKIR